MSYGIMGSSRNSYMLTYQTTRAVPVLYFDGESATLMGSGQMDSQMLQIWGNITGPPRPDRGFGGLWEEYARAIGLCEWLQNEKLGGPGWGFEGIIRMNAGFELIWCDFLSPSLRLVSHLNVSVPLLPPIETRDLEIDVQEDELHEIEALRLRATTSYYPLPPTPTRSDKATDPSQPPIPPNWRRDVDREPFLTYQGWGWFTSATDHYLGESRARITSCGILNYYSPEFQSQALARAKTEQKTLNLTTEGYWDATKSGNRSEALQKLTRRRRTHRLNSITPAEASVMKINTEAVLRKLLSKNTSCSGVDWLALTREMVQRHAVPIYNLRTHLSSNLSRGNSTTRRTWLTALRSQTHSLLLPFLQYPSSPYNASHWSPTSSLSTNTFSFCKFQHTRLLDPSLGVHLSPSETHLKDAIEDVSHALCTLTVRLGFAVEETWLTHFNGNTSAGGLQVKKLEERRKHWLEGVQELMAWLGWAEMWVRCPKCGWEERCYVPMWPLIQFNRPKGSPQRPPEGGGGYPPGYGRRRPPGGGFWGMDETDLWEPRCVGVADIMGR